MSRKSYKRKRKTAIPGLATMRGHGPAPAGFFTCWHKDCQAARSPFFPFKRERMHYHPL